jgi:adenosylcobinamide-GDP ribazoletransferase
VRVVLRFAAALRLLTVLPGPEARNEAPEERARSMGAFPLVGLLLGAILLVFHATIGRLLPDLLEGAALAALLAVSTGALHLDGLADTLDGLAGGWTRERALEIMKDSRVGSIGAAGLCLLLLGKAAGFGYLPEAFAGRALLVTPAVARGAVVWLARGSAYARAAPGLGTAYVEHLDGATVRLAVGGALLSSLLLGWAGVIACGVVVAYMAALKGYFRAKLGGLTGDTFGFAVETAELLFLVCLYLLS